MYSATITAQSDQPNVNGNYTYNFDVLVDGVKVDSHFVESLPENALTNIQIYLDSLNEGTTVDTPDLTGQTVEANLTPEQIADNADTPSDVEA